MRAGRRIPLAHRSSAILATLPRPPSQGINTTSRCEGLAPAVWSFAVRVHDREESMFTVFGASGNTGSVVARRLLDAGKKIRVVVRHPEKVAELRSRGAEVLAGDVTDANTVKSALSGSEGAYLLLPPDNASTDLLARNRRIVDDYVSGLAAARVPHAVMLSSV